MASERTPHRPNQFLAGVKVLDFGRLMPSGIATFELAKLGADVVKVERPPAGDYIRNNEPMIGDRGDIHLELNRNKRSLALDFTRPDGQAAARRLVERADVLVELARPGTMARFGLDWPTVSAVNPQLVYCSFSGYGQTGPYASMTAHGLSADAAGGAMPMDGGKVRTPDTFSAVGPWAAGLYGALAIMAAVIDARSSGTGHYLDAAQASAAAAYNFREIAVGGNTTQRADLTFAGLGPRYRTYLCSDGRYVLLTTTETKLWNEFCQAVDRPDLSTAPDGPDVLPYGSDDLLTEALEQLFVTRSRDEWVALGMSSGLGIAPVVPARELVSDPQAVHRQMVVKMRHPLGGEVTLSGHPVLFDGSAVDFTPAPELGGHSVEVLSEYGFERAEIDALLDSGTLIEDHPR